MQGGKHPPSRFEAGAWGAGVKAYSRRLLGGGQMSTAVLLRDRDRVAVL